MEAIRTGEESPLPRSRYGERPVRVTGTPCQSYHAYVLVQPGDRQRLRGHREAHRIAVIHARGDGSEQGPGGRSRRYSDADRRAAPGVDGHRCAIQQNSAATLRGSKTSTGNHYLAADGPRGGRDGGNHRRWRCR